MYYCRVLIQRNYISHSCCTWDWERDLFPELSITAFHYLKVNNSVKGRKIQWKSAGLDKVWTCGVSLLTRAGAVHPLGDALCWQGWRTFETGLLLKGPLRNNSDLKPISTAQVFCPALPAGQPGAEYCGNPRTSASAKKKLGSGAGALVFNVVYLTPPHTYIYIFIKIKYICFGSLNQNP